jgi:hypothetical protein
MCDLGRTEEKKPIVRREDPQIPDAILDQLLGGARPAFDQNGLVNDLKKRLAEKALNAKMDYRPAKRPLDSGAKRNALKRSGFERLFQARQSRLGKAS